MAAQSVTFSKSESPRSVNRRSGWTVAPARKWLRAHGFKAGKVDETENRLRFRQFPPGLCGPDSFRTEVDDLPAGVQVVDCTPD